MTTDGTLFRLLGPLTVTSAGGPVALGGGKQRLLLAQLLLERGHTVPADVLTETLWPDGPPASARANLQSYVWRLRRLLPAPAAGGTRIASDDHGQHAGYRLVVADDEVDAALADRLVTEAGALAAAGDGPRALVAADHAYELWRGDPLAGLPAPAGWEPELERLAELRLEVAEVRFGLAAVHGRPDAVVGEVRALLADHPYREGLWHALIRALGTGGRTAEALNAYAEVRGRLVDDLGTEPGPALRDLHAELLAGDDPTAERAPASTPANPVTPAPPVCQLPPAPGDFTGRAGPRDALGTALATPGALVTVYGPPGTGKSALALHAAYDAAPGFPDGVLYAPLGGTDPVARTPGDVLGDLLLGLGVSVLPAGERARTALYRARLSGRRVLVVLDDAASAAQVAPLLPAGPGCAALVTARPTLSDLPGAYRVGLDGLPRDEAMALLERLAGPDRVAADRASAWRLLRACDHLPLALRTVGARLADRPGRPLRSELDRLAGPAERAVRLRAGTADVAAGYEASLRLLPDDAARLLALLSTLGEQDLPGWVAAALLDRPDAEPALDRLVEASLVRTVGPDPAGRSRYRVPELLRGHAAGRAPEGLVGDAVGRALEGWLALAQDAVADLPFTFGATTGHAAGWPLDPRNRGRMLGAGGRAWFAAEDASLRHATGLATRYGRPDLAWRLAATPVPYLDLHGRYDDWRAGHEAALAAAGEDGEAALCRGLGQVAVYQDDYPRAERHLSRARRLYRQRGDAWGEAVATAGLGTVCRVSGRPVEALRLYRRCLTPLVRLGDDHSAAQIRGTIGALHGTLGDQRQAVRWLTGAIRLTRRIDDSHREALLRGQLADFYRRSGHVDGALAEIRPAVDVLDDLRDEGCTAGALVVLATSLLAGGDGAHGLEAAERAAAAYHRTGNRSGEAAALEVIAAAHGHRGDQAAARTAGRGAAALRRPLRSTG